MAQRSPVPLSLLVKRAAEITSPFNAQDGVLIIKSLNSLRVANPHVKTVCEKAAFSLASARKEDVPVAVVVDSVNALSSLQLAHLPVVRSVLAKRFRELDNVEKASSGSVSGASQVRPQTLQKAALALMKLGRRYADPSVCDAVLHRLHNTIPDHPHDEALKLAFIGLYPYTSVCRRGLASASSPGNVRASAQTLLSCLVAVSDNTRLPQLRGNAAWQTAHLLPIMARVETQLTQLAVPAGTPLDKWVRAWTAAQRRAESQVSLRSISASKCADFVSDFAEDMHSVPRILTHALTPLHEEGAFRNASRLDFAKVASALGHLYSTRSMSELSHKVCVDVLRSMIDAETRTRIGESSPSSHTHGDAVGDFTATAACWHLTAAMCTRTEGSDERRVADDGTGATPDDAVSRELAVLSSVTAAKVRELSSSSSPCNDRVVGQLSWLVYAVARVYRSMGCQPPSWLKDMADDLLRPSLGPSCSPRTLAQLWLAAALLVHLDTSLICLVGATAQLAVKSGRDGMDAADLGMFLDGSAIMIKAGATGMEEAIDLLLRALLLPSPPSSVTGGDRLAKHGDSIQTCSAFLRRNGAAATTGASHNPGADDAMSPVVALRALSAISNASPEDLGRMCRISLKWAEVYADGKEPLRYGLVLKCAEVCCRSGRSLFFGPCAEKPPTAAESFMVPVAELLQCGRLSRTDAARIVRLLGDVLDRTGRLDGISRDDIMRLIEYALAAEADAVSTPRVLFLLHANRHLSVSNKLFTPVQLISTLDRVAEALAVLSDRVAATPSSGGTTSGPLDPARQLMRVLRALCDSQLPFRVGKPTSAVEGTVRRAVELLRGSSVLGSAGDQELVMKISVLFGE